MVCFFPEKRDITLSSDEANSYLTTHRSKRSFNTGIVCECCLHSCSISEIEQYCANPRRRRSVRDVVTGTPSEPQITEDELKELYKKIDEESEEEVLALTPEQYRKMQLIEQTKRENINKKYAQLFGIQDIVAPSEVESRGDASDGLIDAPQRQEVDHTSSLIANTLKDIHLRRHHHHNSKHRSSRT